MKREVEVRERLVKRGRVRRQGRGRWGREEGGVRRGWEKETEGVSTEKKKGR